MRVYDLYQVVIKYYEYNLRSVTIAICHSYEDAKCCERILQDLCLGGKLNSLLCYRPLDRGEFFPIYNVEIISGHNEGRKTFETDARYSISGFDLNAKIDTPLLEFSNAEDTAFNRELLSILINNKMLGITYSYDKGISYLPYVDDVVAFSSSKCYDYIKKNYI